MDEYKESEESQKSRYKFENSSKTFFTPHDISSSPLSDEEQERFNTEITLYMSPVPETAYDSLSCITDIFIEHPKEAAKLLSEATIKKLINDLSDEKIGPISLHCLDLVVKQRKFIHAISIKNNIFEILRQIMEKNLSNEDILSDVFSLLLSLIKRSHEDRNAADKAKIYDDLDVFCQKEKSYIDNFMSFICFSLKQIKYPPRFCFKFYHPILFAMENPEYTKYGLECIDSIAKNSEECVEFFTEKLIQEALIKSINDEDADIRILSIDYITNVISLDRELASNILSLNPNAAIEESFQYVGSEKTENYLISVMNYIIAFCTNTKEENFGAIHDLMAACEFGEILNEFTFKVKEQTILALRTFVQYASYDMIIDTIGEDICSLVPTLIDKDDPMISYNIILFISVMISKIPKERVGDYLNSFIDDDFMDDLEELGGSESSDTASRAEELVKSIKDILGDDDDGD